MKLNIKNFVIFIGSGRSGSTIIAKILNSHPNVLISSEAGLIKKRLNTKKSIINSILKQTERKTLYNKSINRNLDNKEVKIPKENIFVIGDKHADQDTLNIHRRFELFEIFKASTENLVLINVIRNPFDNINTKYLRKKVMFNKKGGFKKAIEQYDIEMSVVKKLKENNNVLDVKLESLIYNPNKEIKKMFDYFSLEYDDELIIKLEDLVLKTPSISRLKHEWNVKEINSIIKIINNYDWLNGYNFKKLNIKNIEEHGEQYKVYSDSLYNK